MNLCLQTLQSCVQFNKHLSFNLIFAFIYLSMICHTETTETIFSSFHIFAERLMEQKLIFVSFSLCLVIPFWFFNLQPLYLFKSFPLHIASFKYSRPKMLLISSTENKKQLKRNKSNNENVYCNWSALN